MVMSLDDNVRTAIVEALDELGERSALSYAERTSWDEPYPPSFVEERLDDLRRDEWWTKRLLFGILGGVAVAVWVGVWLQWPLSTLVHGVPLLIIPQFPVINLLIRRSKSEQLYALLHQLEGTSEPVVGHSQGRARDEM